jgi:hypothetical protein
MREKVKRGKISLRVTWETEAASQMLGIGLFFFFLVVFYFVSLSSCPSGQMRLTRPRRG